ncbi:hypothetical protein LOK49_LG12G03033 [Camellia lanceoleosa]|uniref:Uncharacterized protein n=1 Tax=Camellia lanceoleosa TaxID=1840588 RepID=A0ACC0FUM4_9ERIC|nr:hypothetical protein LOK49_LG12G03033 [Camellia lanceoleosa]
MVWRVWSELLQWWGVVWVVPGSIQGLFQWWTWHSCRNEERRIWSAIPLVTLWSLWKHRNECIFQGTQPQLQDFHELIITRLAFWYKAASKRFQFSIHDFLFNFPQIRYCLGGRSS